AWMGKPGDGSGLAEHRCLGRATLLVSQPGRKHYLSDHDRPPKQLVLGTPDRPQLSSSKSSLEGVAVGDDTICCTYCHVGRLPTSKAGNRQSSSGDRVIVPAHRCHRW